MFKVLNRKREQVDILENPISPVITNELGGIGELTFSVPATYKHLELEGYIIVENDCEYVIKEIVTHGMNRQVMCILNVEEIIGMAHATFYSKENTIDETMRIILNGTKWRHENKSTNTEKRNLYGTVTNSYNMLQLMTTVFGVEFEFDTHRKVVTILDKVGSDKGVYFTNDLNLRQLNQDTHSHKFITRLIPIGKDGLLIDEVNGGKQWIANHKYSDKEIYGIWQSSNIEDPNILKRDGERFLEEMCIPYETYEVVIRDLYQLADNENFEYELGDVVTIIDSVTETRIQQRVIKKTRNLQDPNQDTINIANKDQTFQDYYKRLQVIADMTESVVNQDGSINGDAIGSVPSDKIEGDISIDKIVGDIVADFVKADSIEADHIKANQIQTRHLTADSITSGHIQANSIDTKHLKADIITSEHIQTGTITAGSGIIADGAIGDGMIANLDAGKLNAGNINTSNVTIQSESGNMLIRDNTIQINDDNEQTRVQIGKDAMDKYNMYVFDDSGNVMFDATGVTSHGIKSPIIRDDMISENAYINGKKINIDSVITEVNSSETSIKSSKILFDDTNQTLDVKFKDMVDTVDKQGEDFTHFKNTEFTMAQGQIGTLIQDTTIEKDGESYKLKDEHSKLEQTVGSITSRVESVEKRGGNNLILNSNFAMNPKYNHWSLWQGYWYTEQFPHFPQGEGIGLLANINELCTITSTEVSVALGDKITVSGDLVVEAGVSSASVCIREFSRVDGSYTDRKQNYSTGYVGKFEYTVEITNPNTKSVRFLLWNNGATQDSYKVVFMNRVQLEKNSKSTNWSLCEQDNLDSKFTEIKQTTDSITSTVSDVQQGQSQLTQKVDGFEFKVESAGRANMLRNSDFSQGLKNWGNKDGAMAYGFSGAPRTSGIVLEECSYVNATRFINQWMDIRGNSTGAYTCSGWAWKSADTQFIHGSDRDKPMCSVYLEITYDDGTYGWYDYPIVDHIPPNIWSKFECTFEAPKPIKSILFYLYKRNCRGTFYATQLKAEEGRGSSNWTPSPNEIYSGVTTIDGEGVKVTHSNGDFTQMTSQGLKRHRGNGDAKGDYHYLTQYIGFSGQDTVWVQLKDDFKGKQFTAYSVISDTWEGSWNHGEPWVVQRFVTYVETDKIDYANARVPVLTYRIDKNYSTGAHRKMPCAGILLVVG